MFGRDQHRVPERPAADEQIDQHVSDQPAVVCFGGRGEPLAEIVERGCRSSPPAR